MGPIEQGTDPFAAEHDPTAVGGPAEPGLAFARIEFQFARGVLARGLAGHHVNSVNVARGIVRGPTTVRYGAEKDPMAVRAHSWLGDAESGLADGENKF